MISELNLQQQKGVKQFLTFIMADEEYGVDILTVQEIRSWEEITVLPNAPEFVKGVINLRGTIVPIIDLRLRFGLPSIEYGPLTVVIVVKIEFEQDSKIIGITVDAVSEVYSIAEQDAKAVPSISETNNDDYVAGLVNVGEKMVALIDLQKTMNI
ncbi:MULTISPECIES: chemotaxis protein CheW [unclassified Pseudoalteromonas]|jgi:purine-binding chemotaxis protein CheW|uniref:chemotaxis protein CheW n=1 Tax=unclassified Pseudoalteromonas TaxID=194690 RepID=UPI0007303C25|nr:MULTISPECIES: chemotaxis protein CheW [unclassified Pseudoalteromonas]KTD98636.1 chemotaxis protein CheW [Pseudoalteromonas sp. H71]MBW4967389.1 chemotaxis protein CheW [Pseudoalteromonas sp. CR1]TMN80937.1 chemotaxis protein CheW [Pseudoalteromonas sp. S410]TMN87772.1 chemotaxis protein CheW [Pseudoalteromonas sp. S408]TMN94818.1 chemotaxis protein CheW [Pseudoalteromonas sp. S407]|tara:strand:- start:25 stop:489 length:465 start_codon:yes stop_codon:yes gene_type:complete